jgi:hypothetical protein
VRKFPKLHRGEFEQFLEGFTEPGSLRYGNNKWLRLTCGGERLGQELECPTCAKRYEPDVCVDLPTASIPAWYKWYKMRFLHD